MNKLHITTRLLRRRILTERGCWEYNGARDPGGYGKIAAGEDSAARLSSAHRVAYKHWVGPIAKGQHVLHHCDNPACFNPEHLFVGTARDNVKDMIAKGRKRVLKGEEHGRHVLAQEVVLEIRKLRNEGMGATALATRFGVKRDLINKIIFRRCWKHI